MREHQLRIAQHCEMRVIKLLYTYPVDAVRYVLHFTPIAVGCSMGLRVDNG